MTATPPPPPPGPPAGSPPPPPPFRPSEVEEKAPPVAWLIPVAGVLAVIGGVTPWFQPVLTFRGADYSADDTIHSWDDGKIGLIGPIVLAVLGVTAVLMFAGRNTRFHRGSTSPVVNLARGAMIAGAVAIVALVIAWFILPSQYDDWDRTLDRARVQDPAAEIGHGPQIGLWLTGAAGVVAIVAGLLILATRKKSQAEQVAAGGPPPPAPGWGQPQAPGYGAPQGQPQAPAYGTPPAQQPPAPPVTPQH